MISKIQKHLLLHYPTIWNVKLVPALLLLTGIHILFFAIGYLAIDTSIDRSYFPSVNNDLGMLYFVSVLSGILILIGWLVIYNRNNSIKTFYPRKTYQLYTEWLSILIISTGLALIPYTMTKGGIFKWKSEASLEDTNRALEIVAQAKILIPSNVYEYEYVSDYDKPIPIPNNTVINTNSLNPDLYAFDYNKNNKLAFKGYIGNSLLFYDGDKYYNDKKTESITQIKEWLKKGNKDSIYAVMQKFQEIQKKNNVAISLTPTQWLKRIYKPPFFPVDTSNIILRDKTSNYEYPLPAVEAIDDTIDENDEPMIEVIPSVDKTNYPYIEIDNLAGKYQQIDESYDSDQETNGILLFCLCASLWISSFIYSYRVSGGKSWLVAFIGAGILIFVSSLLGVGVSSIGSYSGDSSIIFICLFWLSLFSILLINTILKIKSKRHKGFSKVFINILLWLLPCLLPFTYFLAAQLYRLSDYYGYYNSSAIVKSMFWINIPLTILLMWPATWLTRKWKSIPEE